MMFRAEGENLRLFVDIVASFGGLVVDVTVRPLWSGRNGSITVGMLG
jgi:hypothetical protein